MNILLVALFQVQSSFILTMHVTFQISKEIVHLMLGSKIHYLFLDINIM